MEEQKTELQESAEDTAAGETVQESQPAIQTRSFIFWILGGVYLVYTGYQLCKGYLDGAEGSGVGFFIAGAVFIVLGAVLAIKGVISTSKQDKAKRAAEAAERKRTMAETLSKTPGDAPKKMSIAERANLASSLGVNAEDEENGAE